MGGGEAEPVKHGKRRLGLVVVLLLAELACLGFAAAQILTQGRGQSLLALLVFGGHLLHMAGALRTRKRVDGRWGHRHRRALPETVLP